MADKVNLLHIRRVVIENDLGAEVVVSRLLGSKLEADDGEGLALDQANMRISREGLGGILLNLIIDWSIRGVLNLNRLVN